MRYVAPADGLARASSAAIVAVQRRAARSATLRAGGGSGGVAALAAWRGGARSSVVRSWALVVLEVHAPRRCRAGPCGSMRSGEVQQALLGVVLRHHEHAEVALWGPRPAEWARLRGCVGAEAAAHSVVRCSGSCWVCRSSRPLSVAGSTCARVPAARSSRRGVQPVLCNGHAAAISRAGGTVAAEHLSSHQELQQYGTAAARPASTAQVVR